MPLRDGFFSTATQTSCCNRIQRSNRVRLLVVSTHDFPDTLPAASDLKNAPRLFLHDPPLPILHRRSIHFPRMDDGRIPQVDAKRHWSVRQLATEAETLLREKHGVTLATALVLCLSRDAAIPFYGQLFDYTEPKVGVLHPPPPPSALFYKTLLLSYLCIF